MSSAALARIYSGGLAIRYVLPVLQITLCFPIIGPIAAWLYCSSLAALSCVLTPLLRGKSCIYWQYGRQD